MSDDAVTARYSALHRLDSPANRLLRDTIWGRDRDVGQQSFITPAFLDELADRLSLDEHDHVLDVGSGTGGPDVHIARRTGCRITGIDVNAVGVEAGRALAAEAGLADRITFHRGDAAEMPFPDATFSAALSVNVLNVFPDKPRVLRAVHRVLAPGGTWAFLSGTFGPMDEETRTAMARGGRVPQHYDSAEGYRRMLRDAGFVIVEITEYVADFRHQMERWRDAYRRHREAVAAEEGEQQAADHIAYFEAYLRLIDEGSAGNHLFISRRPETDQPRVDD